MVSFFKVTKFIYIYSQPDKFFLWLPNLLFKNYNKATLSQTVFNEFCFLRAKSNEGEWEGIQHCRQYIGKFLIPFFLQIFYKIAHNLGKDKWSRT